MRIILLLALSTTTLLAACGDETCPAQVGAACVERDVRACFDRQPSTPQGYYGCLARLDGEGAIGQPVAGARVQLYADADATSPAGSTVTDAIGYYQIFVQAGTYFYCTDGAPPCMEVPMPVDTWVAVDSIASPAATWTIRDR